MGRGRADVRRVDEAADGEEADDVLPVHRAQSVLHAPRSRGSLIRHEVQDARENGARAEDEGVRRGRGHAFEIRV